MLILQDITYLHPNKDLLFERLNLSVQFNQKTALIGHNGAGKSTILRIIAGEAKPFSGQVFVAAQPYYIPQHFGQYDHISIAKLLKVDDKLNALQSILNGSGSAQDFEDLADDWTVEDRCHKALAEWNLELTDLFKPLNTLSGGQKTKVFLAGIKIHLPQLILMDEPSNHLDLGSRHKLHELIDQSRSTIIIVSHDRDLLELADVTVELGTKGLTTYGGNYSFYASQKEIEAASLEQDIHSQERALKQAKIKARETIEKQQKRNSRGRGQMEKAGVARIMLNTFKDQAEQSASKLQNSHSEKTDTIAQNLKELRQNRSAIDQLQIRFHSIKLPVGKTVIEANDLNFAYGSKALWMPAGLTFKIFGSERLAINGLNGSGKTTLIKLLLGKLKPSSGDLKTAVSQPVYIDQDYSIIDNGLSVYQQAQSQNETGLEEHDVRTRLHQCLFDKEDWDKPCIALSGGERLRLALCCLTLQQQAPDLLILDEPTNNLDIAGIKILTAAVKDYTGTLIAISHDTRFLESIGIDKQLNL